MSLIQRAKTAWNAFMSRAPNLNKSAEEMQQPQQKESAEQIKKDEVNKSDERLA